MTRFLGERSRLWEPDDSSAQLYGSWIVRRFSLAQMLKPCDRMHSLCASISFWQFASPFITMLCPSVCACVCVCAGARMWVKTG